MLHLCRRIQSSLITRLQLSAVMAALLCATHTAAAASITVGSPVNGSKVTSPVLVRAHNVGCNGLPATAFGYSLDDGTALQLGESVNDVDVTKDPIPAGVHTIHFKSWTAKGICPTVTTTFTVAATSPTGIPPNAISSGDLDASTGWHWIHDGGTPGTSTGTSAFPIATPLLDKARKFFMTYAKKAGERWATLVGVDRTSTYFAVDTYVLLPNPSQVLNLEIDVDHTMANGNTVILGTQCSGVNHAWEYAWTVPPHLDHWWATNIKCNPATWTPNVWHHIQIGMHHDANGVVTHDWVTLDGVTSYFTNGTKQASHFMQWAPGITNVQFQIEGSSPTTGTVTAYARKLTVYRWKP